ncbi:uncharacterized protein AC631_00091 [Debaryomyces fabryi]|uniref:Uncharacterized protein n=1 Tax=Debaryomyces fabryi TaxID=58627 RepID=A0A0V1Q708_9ASCO|nr:uncharacterized protein AC631_00091 [Debaryomyces fabryi]KSA04220.1 hypothetical protein AC631_00091 [Debaryomyces fabryi]CUM46279.1 unnamed protein product [Debaryomyces fabryi]
MIRNGVKYSVFRITRVFYSTRYDDQYFSRSPLNYETLSKRLNQFYKSFPPNNSEATVQEGLFVNFIKANRSLQRKNSEIQSKIGFNADQRNQCTSFLDILSVSNSDMEAKILDVFKRYVTQTHMSDEVVKAYLLLEPRPSNIHHLILTVRENFQRNLKKERVNKSVVQTALNVLLAKKDYYNCFKLIDLTYCSKEYLKFCKKRNYRLLGTILLTSLAATMLGGSLLLSIPLYYLMFLNLGVPLGIIWYIMKINLVKHLGRVSWRPYNNFIHIKNYQNEILAVNKVITHFEEHNEVNIKNFHHSKVRQISNLNIFHGNDYIIELPNTNGLLPIDDENTFYEDPEILKLQGFIRQEIRKRKMVLNDIQEELMFLEFWYTHGENFEWVEPDQDPAEIIRLKITNEYPKV